MMLSFAHGGHKSEVNAAAGFTRRDIVYSGAIGSLLVTSTTKVGEPLTYDAVSEGYIPADAAGAINCQAVALEAVTLGDGESATILVLFMGYIQNDAWELTPGASVYAAESDETEGSEVYAGEITTTAPETVGAFVQHLGYAFSATSMFFNPTAATEVT